MPNSIIDYQGGPFTGSYRSIQKLAIPSGAWFEIGDPFEAVVAALRTMDVASYERTLHRKLDEPIDMPFEAQEPRRAAVSVCWYYDAGGVRFRVVVNYEALRQGRVDRIDVYDNPTVRGAAASRKPPTEPLDLFERRRATGNYIGDLDTQAE